MLKIILNCVCYLIVLFGYLSIWFVILKHVKNTNEEIKDLEIQIMDLEIKNTKLENNIKTISQNLKINS